MTKCVPEQQSKTWCPVQLELWAVVNAVRSLEDYLKGEVVIIYTDNRAAFYILTTKRASLKAQYWRWVAELDGINHTIEYIAGKDNHIADMPSRIHCPHDCKNCQRSRDKSVPLQEQKETQTELNDIETFLETESQGPPKCSPSHDEFSKGTLNAHPARRQMEVE